MFKLKVGACFVKMRNVNVFFLIIAVGFHDCDTSSFQEKKLYGSHVLLLTIKDLLLKLIVKIDEIDCPC